MKNYIQPGDFLTISAATDVESGALVVVGSLAGVAAHSATKGSTLTIATEGVFELPKSEGDAFAIGAIVKAENGKLTLSDKGSNVGIATEEAPAGTKLVKVKLR